MAKLTSAQVLKQNRLDAFAPKLKSEATIIASGPQNVGVGLGFPIAPILEILIPILLGMPSFKSSAKTPAEYLDSKCFEGQYEESIIRRARLETRRAAKQDGKGHLKPRELDLITIAAFDRARLNPEESATFATEFYASQA